MKALPKTLCLAGLLTLWTGVIGCDTTGASDPVKVFESASATARTSEFDAAEKLPKLRKKYMRATSRTGKRRGPAPARGTGHV